MAGETLAGTCNDTLSIPPHHQMTYQVVVAATRTMGIGKDGKLPWKLPSDLKFFKDVTMATSDSTKKNAVIMGRKTWESIPLKHRPLTGRLNVVLTRSGSSDIVTTDNVLTCGSMVSALEVLASSPYCQYIERVFVIGGGEILRESLNSSGCDAIHITEIETDIDCDTFIPAIDVSQFQPWYSSFPVMENEIRHCFTTYVRVRSSAAETISKNNGLLSDSKSDAVKFDARMFSFLPKMIFEKHEEYLYLRLVKDIISNGALKGDRTGTGTLSQFGCQMRFNLRKSFPLLTTKKVFWRGVVEELLWFISGSTSAKVLQDKGIHIWDGNASRTYLDSIGLVDREEGDLGPVYGFQWRHFGASYTNMHADYTGQGFDQLLDVIDKIKNNPDDRRILLSAWNPSDLKQMALPPCHMFAQILSLLLSKTHNLLMAGETLAGTCNDTLSIPPHHQMTYQVVVAATRTMGIGKDGKLPWKLPSDLKFFKDVTMATSDSTKKNAVIMGRKTWESIPLKHRPLTGRLNVVLTRSGSSDIVTTDNVLTCGSMVSALEVLASSPYCQYIERVFVIGGGEILRESLNSSGCDAIHITEIETDIDCDTFIPAIDVSQFQPWYSSFPVMENEIRHCFTTYVRVRSSAAETISKNNGLLSDSKSDAVKFDARMFSFLPKMIFEKHEEYLYLRLVKDIISNGALKGDRTGTGTLSQFGCQMRFNLRKSFPLLTTKKVFWRGVVEELLWFISGSTSAKVLQDKGIHIWDGNASRTYLDRCIFSWKIVKSCDGFRNMNSTTTGKNDKLAWCRVSKHFFMIQLLSLCVFWMLLYWQLSNYL